MSKENQNKTSVPARKEEVGKRIEDLREKKGGVVEDRKKLQKMKDDIDALDHEIKAQKKLNKEEEIKKLTKSMMDETMGQDEKERATKLKEDGHLNDIKKEAANQEIFEVNEKELKEYEEYENKFNIPIDEKVVTEKKRTDKFNGKKFKNLQDYKRAKKEAEEKVVDKLMGGILKYSDEKEKALDNAKKNYIDTNTSTPIDVLKDEIDQSFDKQKELSEAEKEEGIVWEEFEKYHKENPGERPTEDLEDRYRKAEERLKLAQENSAKFLEENKGTKENEKDEPAKEIKLEENNEETIDPEKEGIEENPENSNDNKEKTEIKEGQEDIENKEKDESGKEEKIIKSVEVIEAEKKLEQAREKYISEYKKCEKEADRQKLIDKTRNATFNIIAGIKNIFSKNKIEYKKEDFFTEEAKKAKEEYTQARKEMGSTMYDQKKAELEKAGLSGADLEKALSQYKATEILAKTIIDERQKIIDSKDPETKGHLLKRMYKGFMKIEPKWRRTALCTIIFLPLSATGAIGAASIAAGGVGAGIAGLAVTKFAISMGIGYGFGLTSLGIDMAKKGSDLKFTKAQYDKKIELQDKFGKGEMQMEEYEKEIKTLEDAERKRARNRAIVKGVIGGALAITAGYVAYGVIGHGLDSFNEAHNTVDAVSGADTSHIQAGVEKGVGGPFEYHSNVEAVTNDGQGAISTIRELQNNLKLEYGNNLEDAPASVKHILSTDAHDLAKEYGMYNPGEDAESALIKAGSKFTVDQSGNVKFDNTLLEKGTELKGSGLYEEKMFDSDHSGESLAPSSQINPETGLPLNPSDALSETINKIPENNINHIFPGDKIAVWESLKNKSALTLLKLEHPNPEHIALANYLHKLEDVSGIKPMEYLPGGKPESIADFSIRALHEIRGMGLDKLKEVTLDKDVVGSIPLEHLEPVNQPPVEQTEPITNPNEPQAQSEPIQETVTGQQPEVVTSPEDLFRLRNEIFTENLNKIYTNEFSMHLVWDRIQSSRVGDFIKDNMINQDHKELISYLNKLEEVSGKTAGFNDLGDKTDETILEFMDRSLKVIQEQGDLDKVKL